MSDVRYILGISNEEKTTPLSHGRKAKKRKFDVTSDVKAVPKKKKSGLAREVAALALNNPHIVPSSEPQFVERPKINRATKWVPRPITSSANMKFQSKHWVKVTDRPGDYAFAKYCKKRPSLRYTEQEYALHLHKNADGWTKQETDYLMDQCDLFENKFIIVHDRWSIPSKRSIDDIKERYYLIQETLMRVRKLSAASPNPKGDKKDADAPLPFNKEQEILRKKQVDILANRPASLQKEEEALLSRYTNLMTAFKEHKSDSNRVMRLARKSLTDKKQKKLSASASKSQYPKDFSLKLNRYSCAIQSALTELGIQKPSTSDNAAMQKYNDVRNDLCVLFELQRVQAEALYELQVLKGHKAMLLGEDIPIVQLESLMPPPSEYTMLPVKSIVDQSYDYVASNESDSEADFSPLPASRRNRTNSTSAAANTRKRTRKAYQDDDSEEEDFYSSSLESEEYANEYDESG